MKRISMPLIRRLIGMQTKNGKITILLKPKRILIRFGFSYADKKPLAMQVSVRIEKETPF